MTESQSAYPAASRDNIAPETDSPLEQGVRSPIKDPMTRMADRTVHEPVAESAPLARTKAAELCCKGESAQSTTDYDCSWYHGTYQYFRLLSVVATPERNAEFLFDALETLARDGGYPRVLLSGTVDYCMLAFILKAYQNTGAIPQVTVVDRCETPLYLCRWYAEQMSTEIETCVSDIFDFAPAQPFDLICCHSFLPMVPQSLRMDLMKAWYRALRPGGKVVTNVSIIPTAPDGANMFSPEQVAAFRDRAYQEALKQDGVLGISPDQIAEEARIYAERTKVYSFRTQEEIVDMFEAGGFEFERFDITETGGVFKAGNTGPMSNKNTKYAEIVAVRR